MVLRAQFRGIVPTTLQCTHCEAAFRSNALEERETTHASADNAHNIIYKKRCSVTSRD